MKKKVALILLGFMLISLAFASAENNTQETFTTLDYSSQIDKAYSCLKESVEKEDNCQDLTSTEQAFSLLALAYDEKSQRNCKNELLDNSIDNECWPETGCRIKETAISLLALNYIGHSTGKIEDWLLSQNTTPSDLIWYLQIDANERAECKITYDDSERTINIEEDKTLSTDAGSCLTRSQEDYWLKISPSCFNKKFIISCDKDFITNLIYKKENSKTVFVSSSTHSSPAEGQTEEKVNVRCFKQGNKCDYEGSLWAAFALREAGRDIDAFLPYLSATAADNEKYLPDSFLHMLTAEDIYFTNLLQLQTPASYWKAQESPYNKFYDTSLAILSLFSSAIIETEEARDYLISVQGKNGCWQGVRETAFILFSSWPRAPARVSSETDYCIDEGYYCISSAECTEEGGEILDNYYCESLSSKCCSKPATEKLCSEKQGTICTENQVCTGQFVPSLDSGKCCLNGDCEEITESECGQAGHSCKSTCSESNEELKSYSCPGLDLCCGSKQQSSSWIWIIIILVILIAVGVIFRKKLQMRRRRMKTKFSKKN
jgi:hypothetical protein